MPQTKEKLREEQSNERTKKVTIPRETNGLAELGEVESVLRTMESRTPTNPSTERWAEFNEQLMKRVLSSTRSRPLSTEWRQRIFDRFRASDSRLKQTVWVAVAIVLVALFSALAYLIAT